MRHSLNSSLWQCLVGESSLFFRKFPENEIFALKVWRNFEDNQNEPKVQRHFRTYGILCNLKEDICLKPLDSSTLPYLKIVLSRIIFAFWGIIMFHCFLQFLKGALFLNNPLKNDRILLVFTILYHCTSLS